MDFDIPHRSKTGLLVLRRGICPVTTDPDLPPPPPPRFLPFPLFPPFGTRGDPCPAFRCVAVGDRVESKCAILALPSVAMATELVGRLNFGEYFGVNDGNS